MKVLPGGPGPGGDAADRGRKAEEVSHRDGDATARGSAAGSPADRGVLDATPETGSPRFAGWPTRTVEMDKRRLRTALLRQLKAHKEASRRKKSEAIRRRLYRLRAFQAAKTVLCYVSLPYEVQTWRVIAWMLRRGKRVVVPRVQGSRLLLSELRDPAKELVTGAFGVLEPAPHAMRPVQPDAIDLAVIPGLAFDRRGHRLGHGLGYFDRLLKRLPASAYRIGLCFDFQLLDRLPVRPHDQAVDRVLAA